MRSTRVMREREKEDGRQMDEQKETVGDRGEQEGRGGGEEEAG